MIIALDVYDTCAIIIQYLLKKNTILQNFTVTEEVDIDE